jgi:hypothetical protein
MMIKIRTFTIIYQPLLKTDLMVSNVLYLPANIILQQFGIGKSQVKNHKVFVFLTEMVVTTMGESENVINPKWLWIKTVVYLVNLKIAGK